MKENINHNHSLYAIHLELESNSTIVVGKLGKFDFLRGTYIYVGSAKRNLISRINRHKMIEKKYKWHFDYLRPLGSITKIITYENTIGECLLAENLRELENGTFPIKGFGSSDCKCISHLIYVDRGIS